MLSKAFSLVVVLFFDVNYSSGDNYLPALYSPSECAQPAVAAAAISFF
jgi:hypothetical protein